VAQPYDEAAAACLRMLQELLATPKTPPILPAPVLLPPRLVVRTSG
jgi:DNA-binding LacI/PurR family transcriptional regulator